MNKQVSSFLLYRIPFVLYLLERILYRMQLSLLKFYEDGPTFNLLQSVYRETNVLVQPLELAMIFHLALMQQSLEGDMAEVGTYRGGTAKIICSAKGDKHYYGFDTFSGLPNVSEYDTHHGIHFFRRHQFSASYDQVCSYLRSFSNVHLIKGEFPASAAHLTKCRFCFIHLDADLYQSTADGLRFFWDKLVEGGIIIVHDYHSTGVRKAVDEFLAIQRGVRFFRSVSSQVVLMK